MQFMQFTAARADTGAVLSFAQAYVYLTGTSVLAALFNASGTSIGNPVTGDVNGLVGFAAADGLYDVQVTSADSSYSAPKMTQVQLVDLLAMRSSIDGEIGAFGDRVLDPVTAYLYRRLKVLEEASTPYLPALTTSGATYYGVYSTERFVSGSTMALLRAINPTTSASVDLGANAVRVRRFEIKNLRGSAVNVKADKWYDQSGNGRDLTQATAANRPILHEDSTITGHLAMTFPDIETSVARYSHFVSPTISLDRQNFTMFLVIDPTASYKNQIYFRTETSAPATNLNAFHLSGVGALDNGRLALNNGAVRLTSKYIQASPHLLIIRGTSGVLDVWMDDIKVSPANTASTIAKLYLGSDPTNSGLFGNFRCKTCILSDKGLNDGDIASVSAVLRNRAGLTTTYDATIVYSGTSRTASGQADSALSKIFYEQKDFRRNYRVINMGQDGQALSTTLSNFAAREATAYDATKPWIYVIDDAINDLGGLGNSTVPATIYNTTMGGLLAAARALGSNVTVGVRTCLPQDSVGVYGRTSAAIEADRQTLNALILANSLGFDFVTDTAGVASMGTYPTSPDDATKYVDKLHHAALGNSLIASVNAAAIEGLTL
jgi:hypothetical protein